MQRHVIALTAGLAWLGTPFAAAYAAPALTVDAPYVRLVPPNAPTSAAFMVISNGGPSDRTLIKADSPVARNVELHTHSNEDGVMKMRQVAGIEIKAQGQTRLKPGGFHIMLIDLKQPLKAGDPVAITLEFDDGSTLPVIAPVRAPHDKTGDPSPGGHHP